MNDPSMAIFRNISFSNGKALKKIIAYLADLLNKLLILKAGKFILEIKSLNDPEVTISSQPIQICKFFQLKFLIINRKIIYN